MSKSDINLFTYDVDDKTLDLDEIEYDLNSFTDLDDVISYIWLKFLVGGKNRFTIK